MSSNALAEHEQNSNLEELTYREKIVVSSMLFNTEVKKHITHNHLNEDFFRDKAMKRIVQAFNAVAIVGDEPTELLLLDRLAPRKKEDKTKWSLFLKKLKEQMPPEPKDAFDMHLRILKNAHRNEILRNIALSTINELDNVSIDDLMDEENKVERHIENALYDFSEQEEDNDFKSADMYEGVVYTINKLKEAKSAKEVERVTSGYPEIDAALPGGFNKGNFSLIAARPAMGKTVTMLNMAIEAAKTGSKVLFVSIEMTLFQCFQRILCKIADMDGDKIQQPKTMNPDDWASLEKAAREVVDIYDDVFWMEEVTNLTVPQLERMIKKYKKKHNIDMVYVDYAQIMLTKEGNEPKEASDFAQISGGLRRAAKSQNVAVVVGSQLNRKVEERTDKRPIMADIRNSGAFEQDAAQIIGLYRDVVYNKDTEDKNSLELIFLKNRFGESPTIKLTLDLSRQAIFSQAHVAPTSL